jgi:hypothetical protein
MDRKHLQVSVQAFNDEDPHGRRTLGIIYHFRYSHPCLLVLFDHASIITSQEIT